MRIDAVDLEAYKRRSKQLQSPTQAHPNAMPGTAAGQIPNDALQKPGPVAGSSTVTTVQGDSQHTMTYNNTIASPSQTAAPSFSSSPSGYSQNNTGTARHLVITGQDVSLDILMRHIEKQSRDIRPLRSFMGSLDGLISMYRGV